MRGLDLAAAVPRRPQLNKMAWLKYDSITENVQ
jgi:hypothetical protein